MLQEDYSSEQIVGVLTKQSKEVVSIEERIYQHIWEEKKHQERGANENLNGLIRQYINKNIDFTNLSN